jgi:hypothetical protein
MAFGGGIVNPLTAVRDRSEIAAGHKGDRRADRRRAQGVGWDVSALRDSGIWNYADTSRIDTIARSIRARFR